MVHLFKFAYLDPGTGSMVIQSLIGVAAGVALFGRKAVNNVRSKFKHGSKNIRTAKTETKVTNK